MKVEQCPHCCGSGHAPDWSLLSKELRRRRVLAGISLRQAARDAEMSAAHLSDMELGRRPMGGPKAERVLTRFGLCVENAFTQPLETWVPEPGTSAPTTGGT